MATNSGFHCCQALEASDFPSCSSASSNAAEDKSGGDDEPDTYARLIVSYFGFVSGKLYTVA